MLARSALERKIPVLPRQQRRSYTNPKRERGIRCVSLAVRVGLICSSMRNFLAGVIHAYFNNTQAGAAVRDASRLAEMLSE